MTVSLSHFGFITLSHLSMCVVNQSLLSLAPFVSEAGSFPPIPWLSMVQTRAYVGHDGSIASFAEAKELVVLTNNLDRALGEVESEGNLGGT